MRKVCFCVVFTHSFTHSKQFGMPVTKLFEVISCETQEVGAEKGHGHNYENIKPLLVRHLWCKHLLLYFKKVLNLAPQLLTYPSASHSLKFLGKVHSEPHKFVSCLMPVPFLAECSIVNICNVL